MQMNHICLIELGECGNVCTRVGNVDSKKIMFFKASMRRLAAMAAPPSRSDVLMISTLMCIKVYANVRFLEDILDISSKLSAISWEKISKLKRFSANFRALTPIFWASSGWSAMR